ncbi:ribosome maturation factor RimP [Corynebacterium pseudotuberculosis]|uniref:ribosome maturation factor RimP n=1 Tax=Corynebacterium pseudotuberculosis TaxID=1719 RepID=UPI00026604A9|nr:ribosome maturation factor RimP [Corynebacterium pseudotuberculosis]AFM07620.1 ribosome maturation factor RimP [Corynebacterium pseudotuberculosis Cp162]AKP08942.1 Ribosome maturation factor [Corynebacterium pseudotuberculosis]APG81846.1 Ribosome maturation factor [Corynebacterium pseudotuberculosis]WFP66439.1 ribosome maturation factor RimP [Corynebacterium pseudotuberculosis]
MAFPSIEVLTELITPIAAAHNMDLEHIRVNRAGKKTLVAISLDSDNRPDLDQLEVVSTAISELFDAQEASGALSFGPGYTLEVGTPGIDVPLTTARQWRRNRHRLVVLEVEGKKSVERIGAVSDDETRVIVVKRQGRKISVRSIELGENTQAVVEIEFAKPAEAELEFTQLDFDAALALEEENK